MLQSHNHFSGDEDEVILEWREEKKTHASMYYDLKALYMFAKWRNYNDNHGICAFIRIEWNDVGFISIRIQWLFKLSL